MTSVTFARQATLNIRKTPTAISRADPLKYMFQKAFDYLPYHARGHVVAGIGEFIGTMFFYFMAFSGAQVAFIATNKTTQGHIDTSVKSVTPAMLLYIALAAGFSLVVTAWIFYRISGGLFNPVVSVGMVLIGALTIARGVLLVIVQTAGVIVAAYMVDAIFPGGLNVGTALHPEVSTAQGVVIEMLLTSQLVFTIFMLAAEKHEASFLAPVGIGLSAFIAELIGVFWTGGSLNPARSLAPAIVTRTFPPEHWIYWVGPLAGTILAVILYKLIKALEYETAQSEDSDPTRHEVLPTSHLRADNGKKSPVFALSSVTPGNEDRNTHAQPSPPPKDGGREEVIPSSNEPNNEQPGDDTPLVFDNVKKPKKQVRPMLGTYTDKAMHALPAKDRSVPQSQAASQHEVKESEPSIKSEASSMMQKLHIPPKHGLRSDEKQHPREPPIEAREERKNAQPQMQECLAD